MRRHLFFAVFSLFIAISTPCFADESIYAPQAPQVDPNTADSSAADSAGGAPPEADVQTDATEGAPEE